VETSLAPMENSMEVPQILKIELSNDVPITLLNVYERNEVSIFKRYLKNIIVALFITDKIWEQPV
jgi:hypothetical protein